MTFFIDTWNFSQNKKSLSKKFKEPKFYLVGLSNEACWNFGDFQKFQQNCSFTEIGFSRKSETTFYEMKKSVLELVLKNVSAALESSSFITTPLWLLMFYVFFVKAVICYDRSVYWRAAKTIVKKIETSQKRILKAEIWRKIDSLADILVETKISTVFEPKIFGTVKLFNHLRCEAPTQ